VTAAVVGVIANLAVYFAVNTLFDTSTAWSWGPISIQVPAAGSVDPRRGHRRVRGAAAVPVQPPPSAWSPDWSARP
jgi:hypothetical protein